MNIRKFVNGDEWFEIEPAFFGYKIRSDVHARGSPGLHDTIQEGIDSITAFGFKEVKSGIDQNDLQVTCPHVWEAATDSCAICKKSWDSIMWDTHVLKSCCGGGIGKAAIFGGGKWHDSDCVEVSGSKAYSSGSYTVPEKFQLGDEPNYRANGKRCECGSGHTSNPNCHSTWCPEYKK